MMLVELYFISVGIMLGGYFIQWHGLVHTIGFVATTVFFLPALLWPTQKVNESLLDRLFTKRIVVNCDRDPYLFRWYVIRTKPFAVFIHKFIRSDEDRALHDHPWNFMVIPIWRGYYEHSEVNTFDCYEVGPFPKATKRRVYPLLGTRFRRGTYRHRVELIPKPDYYEFSKTHANYTPLGLPSWSLFIRFREFREWGFLATRRLHLVEPLVAGEV